jgi:hypothetical protein
MPQPVDDQGQPTRSFYDFSVPFSLPDLSRASLLRQFFFFSNCLCAPTAMVRRAVYDEVGAYDPRLTNLQDLDMWIRVCANHDIHIMRDQLTAFRIRADLANTSAPRPDTILRCQFETTQILKRYLTLDRKFLAQILGHDLAEHGISLERPTYHWLAELALVAGSMAHKVFALETLFESARTDADCFRIRDLAGELDLFGIESKAVIPKLEADVAEMHKRIHQMELEAEVHHSRFSSSETSLKGE